MSNLNKLICPGIFASFVFFISCTFNQPDIKEARACVEGYLSALQAGNKEKALEFYSDSYDEDGNTEKRMDKINKLEEVMGPVVSYTLTDSIHTTTGDLQAVVLTYHIQHTKINSIQKFTILKDEDGCKIHGHDIQSQN